MVLLGVVLVLLALGGGALLVLGAAQLSENIVIDVFGLTASFPPVVLLLAGAVLMAVLWCGSAVLHRGLRRMRRRRAEAAQAARSAEEQRRAEEARLRQELAAREAELIEERRLREAAQAGGVASGRPAVYHEVAPDQTSAGDHGSETGGTDAQGYREAGGDEHAAYHPDVRDEPRYDAAADDPGAQDELDAADPRRTAVRPAYRPDETPPASGVADHYS
jgi:hypothetical protein